MAGTSRVNREVYARFCGRLEVKFLRPTRQPRTPFCFEMAAALDMKRPSVSRAMKLLADKQIILRGPKIGNVSSYRLNPHYGGKGKGKVQNLTKTRQEWLRVVATEIGPDCAGRSGERALSAAMGR